MQAYLGAPATVIVEHAGVAPRGHGRRDSSPASAGGPPQVRSARGAGTCSITRSGRTVSRTDRDLHALALMPLAMSLEVLAEAAARLVRGRTVTGLRDVRAHHWLAWEDAPRKLELRARRLDAHGRRDRVHVELRTVADDETRPGPSRSRLTSCLRTA